ncbi:pescadillo homolog isoform X2 [Mercenaria mercenaria]|uniref:pescadillo homolog isoform X2 n=1 Tax=Mercenaria mercenaria TaxID=6596 RepID=UPI00234F9D57|nr:pescadillo homolog isoform X2 [Mercenaria mercenaria]
MGRPTKKHQSGAATAFITRTKAVKRLQISLKDFRRLCILKGIYPVEPLHRKKAGKGSTSNRTYYFVKDIQFLLHEPLINKFREFKHFMRRLKKAYGRKNLNAAARIRKNRPKYKLDHIVKERYPSFIDAVRDLDDCLSMVFLFSTFPQTNITDSRFIQLCRRLTVEFMHYVIASQSLRKVFISIKGIYYQAEIMGQTVTWVTPHKVGFAHPTDVDYKVMKTFAEFYTTLLGFVNFKLYNSINLKYPPKLLLDSEKDEGVNQSQMSEVTKESTQKPKKKGKKDPRQEAKLNRFVEKETLEERLSALTQSLKTIGSTLDEDVQLDHFPSSETDNPDGIELAKIEMEKLSKFQNLFKGLKFFLNREVPREPLVFIIRSFGGEVSWFETQAVGATYKETDEKITHQIVDRPSMEKQFLSRYYVQPQWLIDCVNAQMILPPDDYFMGAVLPPHLSPFVNEQEGDYVPPEKQVLLNRQRGIEEEDSDSEVESGDNVDDDDEGEADAKEKSGEEEEEDEDSDEDDEDSDDDDEDSDDDESEEETVKRKKNDEESTPPKKKKKKDEQNTSTMSVEAGTMEEEDVNRRLQQQTAEERRLAEMMIPKKKKRLYKKIMYSRKKKSQEALKLKQKRHAIDKQQKLEKKKQKVSQ